MTASTKATKKATSKKATSKKAASKKTEPPVTDVTDEVDEDQVITVHFMEDGFTALGRLFYRGEELTVARDSEEYERTRDKNGDSWLDLTEDDQYRKHGKLFFRRGPWPFSGYDAAMDPEVHTPDDLEALKRIEKQRQRTAGPPYGAPKRNR